MASHYVSLARGIQGEAYSDFTTGTSSTAGDMVELRVLDGVSPKPSRLEIIMNLKAFVRFMENAQQVNAAGLDVLDG